MKNRFYYKNTGIGLFDHTTAIEGAPFTRDRIGVKNVVNGSWTKVHAQTKSIDNACH